MTSWGTRNLTRPWKDGEDEEGYEEDMEDSAEEDDMTEEDQ